MHNERTHAVGVDGGARQRLDAPRAGGADRRRLSALVRRARALLRAELIRSARLRLHRRRLRRVGRRRRHHRRRSLTSLDFLIMEDQRHRVRGVVGRLPRRRRRRLRRARLGAPVYSGPAKATNRLRGCGATVTRIGSESGSYGGSPNTRRT